MPRVFNLDRRLKKKIKVKYKGSGIFNIYDFGEVTRQRDRSFEQKEPETLEWIDSFKKDESFLDIVANIGIYTLFAELKGQNCFSGARCH